MKEKFVLLFSLISITSYSQFGEQQILNSNALQANSVFAIDIDGDEDVDVLSASPGNTTIAWYENLDNDGTFSEPHIISDNLEGAWEVYADDLDNDGDIDVLALSANDHKLGWYENLDGQGNFGKYQLIITDNYDISGSDTGDIDGDGDIDIITSLRFEEIIVWQENIDGLGDFSTQHIIYNEFMGSGWVHVEDLDNDGDLDVISGSRDVSDNEIVWFENLNSLGSFGEKQLITTNIDVIKDIHSADIDGDGDMDVLSASRNDGKVAWYENTDGQGTFGDQKLISGPDELYAFSVYTTDLDNDGDLDVISGRGDDFVTWYKNLDGLGNFSEGIIISTDVDGVTSVFAADLNNDGFEDVLSASYFDNKIAWYENTGELGINEVAEPQLSLYPNPVTDILSINNSNTHSIGSIIVYNILGKIVIQRNSVTQYIDVSNLQSGVYFVELETEKGSVVKRMIKQ